VRSIHNSLLCGASALALCSIVSSVALAQEAGTETVVVTGVRGSMRDSLIEKKNSPLVTDNVSTKDIGQLPDVTIAEELNRLPGVNTTRDRGNASQAAVRGLGPRLVFGLVNGREVASSEPSQDVRWEVYPSEVLSGAQVYKSQSAEIIPGGIAATIDIRTIQPLDYEGPEINLRAGPTYNSEGSELPHYDPYGFRASGAYITHINDDFAVAIAASYQKEKNGFPDFRTFGWNTPDGSGASTGNPDGNTGDLNGDGVPDNTNWGLVTEVKEVTQDRRAVMGAIGWRANANLEIKADALYSAYTITEDQFQTWYANNLGNWNNSNFNQYNCAGCSYTIKDNSVVAADLENIQQNGPSVFFAGPDYQSQIARYKEEHGLDVAGLNMHWQNGAWDAKLDLSHSDAWRDNRWSAIYLDTQWATGIKYNVAAGHTPTAQILGPDPGNPAIQSIGGLSHDIFGDSGARAGEIDPEHSSDTLSAAALDVSHTYEGSFLTGIDFGARLSDRAKRHDQWQSHPTATPQSLAGDVSEFTLNAFDAAPNVYGDWDKLFPLVYPGASAAAQSAANELPLSHSRVTEQTQEGYVKADFSGNFGSVPMTGSLGVRIASVQTRSSGNQTQGGVIAPVSLTNRYTDVLPDLNMVFNITDDSQIHFGAGVAISRPPLDALTAGFSLPVGCTPSLPCSGAGGGNPFLKPYKADQVDLSYEWYFHDESLFAIAPYYKHLLTYITAASNLQVIGGQPYIVTDQGNGKGGNVEGVEVTFQTRFYFLQGFLSDFGVYANYAYAQSDIKEVAPSTVGFGQTPYSMVGLTKNTAELDLFYNRGGFEGRIAYKYHSPNTVAPTWVGTTLKKEDAEGILDASMSYQWNEHIGLRLQGRNLTNEPNRFSSDNDIQNLSNDGGYQVFGRSFLFDISYKD
jgi:iron complex outermembrane receptor protein